jgi:hypothetical protein
VRPAGVADKGNAQRLGRPAISALFFQQTQAADALIRWSRRSSARFVRPRRRADRAPCASA